MTTKFVVGPKYVKRFLKEILFLDQLFEIGRINRSRLSLALDL